MFIYAAGYNFAHLSSDEKIALSIPDFVSHVELGIREYKLWVSKKNRTDIKLSLHLARTPITECDDSQNVFVEYLYEEISKTNSSNCFNNMSSIGIHLTGPRYEGIGKFGFSSHFILSNNYISRAIQFVNKLQQKFQIPVWIENANFYSKSPCEILDTWKAITTICYNSNVGLIVDLSHLIIDAKNNNLDPAILLGAIPWQYLVELHLSGIIIAKDGSWHDGHSQAVHHEVWSLLHTSLNGLIRKDKEVILTIEHTDTCWAGRNGDYISDFIKLKSIIDNIQKPVEIKNSLENTYAKNYLKKLLKQWLPNVLVNLGEKNISFDFVFDRWIEKILQDGKRVVFTAEEVPFSEQNQVCIAAKDFSDFANRVLTVC